MDEGVNNEINGIGKVETDQNMSIGFDEIVLFAIGECFESDSGSVDKDDICKALDISRRTLNGRLSNLVNNKILVTDPNERSCGYRPTNEGWNKLKELRRSINGKWLVPEIHNSEGRVGEILPAIRNPLNRIKIVVYVIAVKPLDVNIIQVKEMAKRPDSLERKVIKELENAKIILDKDFESMVVKLTIAGKGPKDLSELGSGVSIEDAALFAEMLWKKSRPEQAMEIFLSVVSRCDANSGFRVFGLVGIIKCTRSKKIDGEDEALKLVGDFLPTAKSPVHQIMLKKCQADILTYQDPRRALDIYLRCIKSLAKRNLPAIKAIIYNNIGVAFVELSDWNEAERYWKKAHRICIDFNYERFASTIKLNLADAMSRNGKFKRADQLLGEAKKFFESEEDLEGLSGYHYNAALISADEGKRELSLKHFRKCLECGSIPAAFREKRYHEMNKRFEKMGWIERFPEKT